MKDKFKQRQKHRIRVKKRIRKKVSGTSEKPRLVVFRANNNISSQLVDDVNQKTLCTVSSVAGKYESIKKSSTGKIDISHQIGLDIAEQAKKFKVKKVVFDRNGFKYHGRVKAVAEGARKGGLEF